MNYHRIKTHSSTPLTSNFSTFPFKHSKLATGSSSTFIQTLPSPSIPQIITIYPKCCNLNLYFDKAHPSHPLKALK